MPPTQFPQRRPYTAPNTVLGYHGCTRATAEKILTEQQFALSENAYDWLGKGIYFWEYAPYRALDWARRRFEPLGQEAAVIGVTIRLGNSLNLLDVEHVDGLQNAYRSFVQTIGLNRMPRNTRMGAHYLDREIIDTYCRIVVERGIPEFQTVRGCFPEGQGIYEGSKILELTHVQIAVRDASCLSHLHLVRFP